MLEKSAKKAGKNAGKVLQSDLAEQKPSADNGKQAVGDDRFRHMHYDPRFRVCIEHRLYILCRWYRNRTLKITN